MDKVKETKSCGGIVINTDGKVLVVSQHGTFWSLPKGHVEESESEIQSAKREIYEEAGITDLKMIKKLGKYNRYKISRDGLEDRSEHKTIIIFLFKTTQMNLRPVDPDNPEALWIDKEDVADLLTHEKDKEFYMSIKNEIQEML